MSHTIDGQTTTYTWDVAASLPVVLQDNTYTYVYGPDLISATDASGNQRYYLHNGLGSVANIVDYSGAEKARYLYDAFGNPRYSVEFTSNVWRYTGEQRDAESGLYYLRARYYDPATGRFLGQDPLRGSLFNPQSLNLYAYVGNNPTNRIDPSGLRWMEDGSGGGSNKEGGFSGGGGGGGGGGGWPPPTPCPTPTETPTPTPAPTPNVIGYEKCLARDCPACTGEIIIIVPIRGGGEIPIDPEKPGEEPCPVCACKCKKANNIYIEEGYEADFCRWAMSQ